MAKWYYRKGGAEHGPISTHQLKELARTGQIEETDRVKKEGMEKWTRATKVQGLFGEETSKTDSDQPSPEPRVENDSRTQDAQPPDLKTAAKTFFDTAASTLKTKAKEATDWTQKQIETRKAQVESGALPRGVKKVERTFWTIKNELSEQFESEIWAEVTQKVSLSWLNPTTNLGFAQQQPSRCH